MDLSCAKVVKSKLDYSHIPVILLTAKTNIQSKIEGLELGRMRILKNLSLLNIYRLASPI